MGTQHHTRPTRTSSGTRGLSAIVGPHRVSLLRIRHGSLRAVSTLVAAAVFSLLGLAWMLDLPQTITLTVDGASQQVQTRQRQVGAFLAEIGLDSLEMRRVTPPLDSPLHAATPVVVERIRPIVIADAGRQLRYGGEDGALQDALDALKVTLGQRDVLRFGTALISPTTALSVLRNQLPPDSPLYATASALTIMTPRAAAPVQLFTPLDPVVITVERAMPIVMHERGVAVEVQVRLGTLREALADAGAPILPGDLVRPDPDAVIAAGAHVYIHRARSLALTVDRQTTELRSRAATVAGLLAEQSVALGPLDRIEPALTAPVRDEMAIKVVRVREEQVIEDEDLPNRLERIPDDTIEFGSTEVKEQGSDGLRRRFYRVRYEDGDETERTLVEQRLVKEPVNRVVHYGVHPPTVMAGAQPLHYLRKLRVWATWYDASHGGKPRSSPAYGLTALGMVAQRGIMAVDPRVIPLRSKAYVPGYGVALAADTGGGIKGNMIDLAFAENDAKTWGTKWVDIYILGEPTQADAYRAAFGDE